MTMRRKQRVIHDGWCLEALAAEVKAARPLPCSRLRRRILAPGEVERTDVSSRNMYVLAALYLNLTKHLLADLRASHPGLASGAPLVEHRPLLPGRASIPASSLKITLVSQALLLRPAFETHRWIALLPRKLLRAVGVWAPPVVSSVDGGGASVVGNLFSAFLLRHGLQGESIRVAVLARPEASPMNLYDFLEPAREMLQAFAGRIARNRAVSHVADIRIARLVDGRKPAMLARVIAAARTTEAPER